MTTFFVGNELNAFTATSGAIEQITDAVAGITRGRIALPNTDSITAVFSAPQTEFWSHFTARWGITDPGFPFPQPVVEWRNGVNVPVYRLAYTTTVSRLQPQFFNGTAWVNAGADFTSLDLLDDYDVFIRTGVSGQMSVFRRGTQLSNFLGDTSVTGGNIATLRLASRAFTSTFYTQVLVAAYSTIGHIVTTRVPNAAGTFAEWTGAVANISEYPDVLTTSITSANAGERNSYAGTAAAAPGVGNVIKAVAIAARARRDASGPQNLQFFMRIGVTSYDTPVPTALGLGYTGSVGILVNDPSTNAPWVTLANVNSQFGVRSLA